MGARTSRPKYDKWNMNEIQRATGLPADQIQQLYQEFSKSAGRDGVLNQQEFAKLYARFPGAQNQPNLEQQVVRLFQTLDRDHTGTLSFDEFLSAVVMLNHDVPRTDRIQYVIQQNNPSGQQYDDGRISSQYGHQVFRRLNDYYGLPPGTEHQCWKQVDQQNRGYVTQQELMNYIAQQEGYNQRYQ